jgi:5-methylcytosine-specific restriction endonuclease McrA
MRARILQRDGFRCRHCGARATEVDHLVPRALGGSDFDPANLAASCSACNAKRAARLREELGVNRAPWDQRHDGPRFRAGAIAGPGAGD